MVRATDLQVDTLIGARIDRRLKLSLLPRIVIFQVGKGGSFRRGASHENDAAPY